MTDAKVLAYIDYASLNSKALLPTCSAPHKLEGVLLRCGSISERVVAFYLSIYLSILQLLGWL